MTDTTQPAMWFRVQYGRIWHQVRTRREFTQRNGIVYAYCGAAENTFRGAHSTHCEGKPCQRCKEVVAELAPDGPDKGGA